MKMRVLKCLCPGLLPIKLVAMDATAAGADEAVEALDALLYDSVVINVYHRLLERMEEEAKQQ